MVGSGVLSSVTEWTDWINHSEQNEENVPSIEHYCTEQVRKIRWSQKKNPGEVCFSGKSREQDNAEWPSYSLYPESYCLYPESKRMYEAWSPPHPPGWQIFHSTFHLRDGAVQEVKVRTWMNSWRLMISCLLHSHPSCVFLAIQEKQPTFQKRQHDLGIQGLHFS